MFPFSRSKMNANYAELCRIHNLEANLFHLFKFSEFFTISLRNSINSESGKKSKNIF